MFQKNPQEWCGLRSADVRCGPCGGQGTLIGGVQSLVLCLILRVWAPRCPVAAGLGGEGGDGGGKKSRPPSVAYHLQL